MRPDLERSSAEDIEHAQLAWSHRVLGEYRGVVIYTDLLAALVEAEAPYPALADVHRIRRVFASLLRDEVRHAAAGRSLVARIERSYPESELAGVQARLHARLPEERRHLREQALARAVGGPGRQLGARLAPGDLEA
ncbi:hypothetical protein [Sorangium sp. So ce145]|uniref:hypothetical protein n=1 Tax=Sorangium sp. So ce145 TaxID=3133285 RepID=UPI003F5F0366